MCEAEQRALSPLLCDAQNKQSSHLKVISYSENGDPPPPAVVFRIAVMDLLFMSLSCDDLFRSALQSEIPLAAARCFSSWGRAMC